MRLSDTHCHLDLNAFDVDRAAVLERAARAGVERILIPGLTLTSSRAAVQLAQSHPMLFAAIGVHPTEAMTWDEATRKELRRLARPATPPPSASGRGAGGGGKIVAIGEIGLDYYWDAAAHDLQQHLLQVQLDLAAELSLPVVIHLREKGDAAEGPCAADLLRILEGWVADLRARRHPLAARPGVLHSFSGSLETARQALALNFFLGVSGPLTYRKERQEWIAALPLDHLLIETDAPFLSPHPHRGRRNEPSFVTHIADKIAEIQSRNPQEIAAITSANAARLFSWGENP